MVPLYQRKYQWHDTQLIPFWEDVEAKAIEVLEGTSKFQHYMGALILAPIGETAQIGVTPRVQIVDGQQRLTTFQILLSAIREVALKHGCEDVATHVTDYLFNKLKAKDTPPSKYKLTPTPSDQKVFFDILDERYDTIRVEYDDLYWHGHVPKNTQVRALRAYEELHRRIDLFVQFGAADSSNGENHSELSHVIHDENDTEEAIETRLTALLTALLNRIKLVVIILGEDDDAQVIFETLNSKGEPLLAMDLVRNNIFYRAEKEEADVDELYKKLWDPFDDPWWRESAPFARPSRPRIDHFLTHMLAAETGQKISMRELYAEYRDFAVPKGSQRFLRVEDELRLLVKYAPIYETLEGRIEGIGDLRWLGRKLAAWQVTTAYPVAMQICLSDIPNCEKRKLYTLVYSYIVRRALAGLTAKNLNNLFQGISQAFLRDGPSLRVFKDFFSDRKGDSTRFPNDNEFRQGIFSKPAYTLAPGPRIKDVLWELELASRSHYAETFEMPSELWTEHMLPVSWTEEWPFEDGEFVELWSDDPKAEYRNNILHTLGNLTLLKYSLNIAAGNNGFIAKREMLEEHTGLFLNRWFRARDSWNETEIRKRSESLSELAIEIWPTLNFPELE